MTEPTNAELARRFDDSARRTEDQARATNGRLDELIKEIRADRQEARTTYVQKIVYDAHREADDRRISDIEDDQEKTTTFRRQTILALTGTGLGVLVTIVLFVITQVTK